MNRILQSFPVLILTVAIATYIIVFGILTWNQHTNFGTFGFDMGIYDQAIWLLSRFEEPFVTVRGMNFFGHHVNLTTVMLTPFYWIGAGPRFLYLFETVVLAAGAIPLWLLAKRLFDSAWLGLTIALAYLLYPSIAWINWWHFHPDSLSVTPLLFAWWFAFSKRWKLYALSVILALGAKEDASFAVSMMGLLVAIRCFREQYHESAQLLHSAGLTRQLSFYLKTPGVKWGSLTFIAGICWWVICSKLIMPLANGGESSFYAHWFPGFGNTPYEVAKTILGNPGHFFTSISTDEHLTYYLKIFGPTGFLALLSPVTLIGFPQLVVNAISAHGYTHDFRFHYTSIVAASVFLGTTHAVAWFGQHRRALRRVLAILVLVIALVAHIAWSPSPIGAHYRTGTWAGPSERHGSLRTALQMIPDDAAVTATYYIVPHLTHRKQIFEFPNPFRLANWGINGERPGNPDDIDFLMIDEHVTGADSDLFRQLIGPEGPYSVVFSEKGLTLAKRKAT